MITSFAVNRFNNEEDHYIHLVNTFTRLPETPQNQERLRYELKRYRTGRLSSMFTVTINPINQCIHYQNLAALLVWHGLLVFLDIVLLHESCLLWQRTPSLRHDRDKTLTTPLDAATHSCNLSLLDAIVKHPGLVSYASRDPIAYASLVDRSLTQAREWFPLPRSKEEAAIVERLELLWIDSVLQ